MDLSDIRSFLGLLGLYNICMLVGHYLSISLLLLFCPTHGLHPRVLSLPLFSLFYKCSLSLVLGCERSLHVISTWWCYRLHHLYIQIIIFDIFVGCVFFIIKIVFFSFYNCTIFYFHSQSFFVAISIHT